MSKQVPAAAVMAFLSELYSRLDALVDEHGVWKVRHRTTGPYTHCRES